MESQAKKKNAKLEKLSVFAKQNKNSLIRYGLLIAVLLVFSVSTNGRIFPGSACPPSSASSRR